MTQSGFIDLSANTVRNLTHLKQAIISTRWQYLYLFSWEYTGIFFHTYLFHLFPIDNPLACMFGNLFYSKIVSHNRTSYFQFASIKIQLLGINESLTFFILSSKPINCFRFLL